ncbi:MAG: HAMP domain-containing histidine kinase [Dehalococcoidia bacterium]|nr:HAMP domain-containing histidine kinase [Dehalococcoidia bacterium]
MAEELPPTADNAASFYRELDTQVLVHELKSPLALIESTTRMLLAQAARLGPLTARQEKALDRILRGAVRGRRLVDHLLEIGRAEASAFAVSAFRPGDVVLHVLIDAAEIADGDLAAGLGAADTTEERVAVLADAGISLRVAPGVAAREVSQDLVKFGLIVSNLIQNGLRFRRRLLEVDVSDEAGRLVVTVRDDGPGIAPEHHAAVFEQYRQVAVEPGQERKGHGLGLAGARIMARRLGGDITLTSEPGDGATFRLEIPATAPPG